jgi:transcriptional regulator with XRE-family HTH domain
VLRPLGAQLRRLRLDRQMTQENLAELASLNYKYIGRIELGKADPGAEVLVRLARALAVSVGELFETITPARGMPPALPLEAVEAVTSALQTLTAAIERLLSDQPRHPAFRASRRRSR